MNRHELSNPDQEILTMPRRNINAQSMPVRAEPARHERESARETRRQRRARAESHRPAARTSTATRS